MQGFPPLCPQIVDGKMGRMRVPISRDRRGGPRPFVKHWHRVRAPRNGHTKSLRSFKRTTETQLACGLKREFQGWAGLFSRIPEVMAKFRARAVFCFCKFSLTPVVKDEVVVSNIEKSPQTQ